MMLKPPCETVPDEPTPESGAPALSEDDLRHCTRLLERLLEDPGALAFVGRDVREALIRAAGRVARPDVDDRKRISKALRRRRALRQQQRERDARAQAQIRQVRRETVFTAPPQLTADENAQHTRLPRARDCYVCKVPFQEQHFFYDAMCLTCSAFNYAKRFQTAPMHDRVVLVTGARVKIGFHIALKLLRAGARVIVTTRFPRDAALRFARETDFAEWAHRLDIHGLDLRHAPSVEIFAHYLAGTLPRLDALINNACQTVRRPPGFYAHMLELETGVLDDLPAPARALLASHEACKAAIVGSAPAVGAVANWNDRRTGIGLVASAALSQIPYPDDGAHQALEAFPAGQLDADLQQVDLRARNSWRLTLAEVPTAELLEVHLVNAISPFILNGRLRSLMARDRTNEKHIVNVSAMEGKFARRTKTDRHPHTNMAKAGLNMMTLTSAPDFLKDGIHMNAVDTGWVTDEDPAEHAARKLNELDFQPPLDIVDGAARVLDPIFWGLISGEHVSGLFLKNYKPTDW